MSEVKVAGVAIDSSGQHVILLKPIDEEPGEGKIVPIWIGGPEAASILIAVDRANLPRPFAHDLMKAILDELGGNVHSVEITKIEDGTFYAVLHVTTNDGEHVIDARPSDAIALASRTESPIHVSDQVFDAAGIADTFTGDASRLGASVSDDVRLDEFRDFLDSVDPEDFKE